jgi:hypothetical protein
LLTEFEDLCFPVLLSSTLEQAGFPFLGGLQEIQAQRPCLCVKNLITALSSKHNIQFCQHSFLVCNGTLVCVVLLRDVNVGNNKLFSYSVGFCE